MNRVGQVWDLDPEIGLVVRSRVFGPDREWVHDVVYIDRVPPDVDQYPALETLFADSAWPKRIA